MKGIWGLFDGADGGDGRNGRERARDGLGHDGDLLAFFSVPDCPSVRSGGRGGGKKERKKKRTVPGTVMVVSAQPKQWIEYVDVAVVFHTVTVAAVLVVTTPWNVQLGHAGATRPPLLQR